VQLPEGFAAAHDLFTEAKSVAQPALPLAQAFARLPFAVLRNSGFQPDS